MSYWGFRGAAALFTAGASETVYQTLDVYDGLKLAYDATSVAYNVASRAQEGGAGAAGSYMARLGARQTFSGMRDDDDD